jgi:predicted PhzF superfamily epimerase YddE/YHI9
MDLPMYVVDAFADRLFAGNPAAVCILDGWPADDLLASIARENNLSETAFLVRAGETWELRWRTPTVEVDLCGHATLAAGAVLLTSGRHDRERVEFETKSGTLSVWREGELFWLDLPSIPPGAELAAGDPGRSVVPGEPISVRAIRSLHHARYVVAEYGSVDAVTALRPDFRGLRVQKLNVVATAAGEGVDFVSRFFAPSSGVDEDPVTGSAHCTLAPLWADRLGRNELRARQVSARGGTIRCVLRGDRVYLGGRVIPYLEGWITL